MSAPKKKRSFARRLLKVLFILFSLFVLWLGYVLVAAFFYYRDTPMFEDFVASTPVAQEFALEQLPQGQLLHKGGSWSVGEELSDTLDGTTYSKLEVTIERDSETLLSTTVSIQPILEPEDWIRRGFHIEQPAVQVRDGMRSLCQVSLYKVLETLGKTGESRARVVIDVMLLAGEGGDVFRVVELSKLPEPGVVEPILLPIGLTQILNGVHPALPPPKEGLLYHVRSHTSLEWYRSKGHPVLTGSPKCEILSGDSMYTCAIDAKATIHAGGGSTAQSVEMSWQYLWKNLVW